MNCTSPKQASLVSGVWLLANAASSRRPAAPSPCVAPCQLQPHARQHTASRGKPKHRRNCQKKHLGSAALLLPGLCAACGARLGDLPCCSPCSVPGEGWGLTAQLEEWESRRPFATAAGYLPGLPNSSGFLAAAEGAVVRACQEAGVNKVPPRSGVRPGQRHSQAPREASGTARATSGQAPSPPATAYEAQQDLGMRAPRLASHVVPAALGAPAPPNPPPPRPTTSSGSLPTHAPLKSCTTTGFRAEGVLLQYNLFPPKPAPKRCRLGWGGPCGTGQPQPQPQRLPKDMGCPGQELGGPTARPPPSPARLRAGRAAPVRGPKPIPAAAHLCSAAPAAPSWSRPPPPLRCPPAAASPPRPGPVPSRPRGAEGRASAGRSPAPPVPRKTPRLAASSFDNTLYLIKDLVFSAYAYTGMCSIP